MEAENLYDELTDEEMVDTLVSVRQEQTDLAEAAGHIEMELSQRMEADERDITSSPSNTAEIVRTYSYDQSKLMSLGEFLPAEVIEEAWIPEAEVTTVKPGRWDMVKRNKIAKTGGKAARDVLESARFVKSRKLVTKAK